MDYNFNEIEKKWQEKWAENKTYSASNQSDKPKYYVLDMFPYPSGAGLHVGHPLGYIASDIYARYKRLKGFNVLHPMGYDAYGLPAEQYAIQTGQHPALTTEININRYREQLDKLGLSFDWEREVRTCQPAYYKWTQWTFIQLFNSYYCYDADQARPIAELADCFKKQGSIGLHVACTSALSFSAEEWNAKSEKEQQEILMNYRLAYLSHSMVNWCPALGTVLANDEVINGVSVRGGYPVERKLMQQWSLRITAYAERLLEGLNRIEWSDSLKEIQRNWIGRSEGAMVKFRLTPNPSPKERGTDGYGYVTTDKLNWNANIENAKEQRTNSTEAENILWNCLRNRNIDELKFRRQHLIDQFIVDFVCLEKSLIVEVDGEYHDNEDQKQHDEARTEILNELGFQVIRFTNKEILHNIENVISQIRTTAANSPSFGGGRGEVEIFTTRPDTIFGATFMVLCPEHELITSITTDAQREEVEKYVTWAKNRSERERQSEIKRVSGVFTGGYAVNPLNNEKIPVWVSDYVLAGYGTGAIMAVPAHDSRDFAFARHFNLPVIQVVVPKGEQAEDTALWTESKDSKEGTCINSDFINGKSVKEAITAVINRVKELNIGYGTVNYRLRDAIFSRQRYWGEPFPMYYKDGIPYPVDEKDLPILLPEVDKYLPTESGEPPLARAKNWTYRGYPLDFNTMPGFAGSNAYYLRYMDAHNEHELIGKEANNYWQNVDLYIGGSEHATGHLLYSRMWNKFLFDLGIVCKDEPFQKLINQGMIQGRSSIVYRIEGSNQFVSHHLKDAYQVQPLHVDINIVDNDILDIEQFKKWRPEFADAEFILEDGKYICGVEVEKMSKSFYNVQNPDDLVEKYGADTLRMYEMFLGPIEQSKPWDTKGIEGVFRFIRKLWKLYHNAENMFCISEEAASKQELKILHKTIKKVQEDIERLSLNTTVSAFMICVNELTDAKCNKRAILEPLSVLIAPFAPHLAEELWSLLGHADSVVYAAFPQLDEAVLVEDAFSYPVSFNGKTRFMLELSVSLSPKEVEDAVLQSAEAQRWLEGKMPKKVIVVPKKIVNIVI